MATVTTAIEGGLDVGKLLPASYARRALERPEPTGLRRWYLISRRRALEFTARVVTALLWRLDRVVKAVECPICSWRGLRFRPFVGPGYFLWNERCPGCGAAKRQRLMALAFRRQLIPPGPRLYVAPESCLEPFVRQDGPVITTDLFAENVAVRADAQALPFAPGSFAAIVCSDVLEHVEDDQSALAQIREALSPVGVAYVHVPVLLTETVDYGRAIEVDYGHRRAYGPDLLGRVANAGLSCSLVRACDLTAAERRRFGLQHDSVLVLRSA
jgi:Methyltransferase domain